LTLDKPVQFECPQWAYQWKSPEDFEEYDTHDRIEEVRRPENFDRPSRGKGRQPHPEDINGGTYHQWWVEYGGILDTIEDAEKIRDELFRINIGLWNYAKNHNPKTIEKNKNRKLAWLNYVAGVRESRRLLGDYIMSQAEYDNNIVHNDTAAFTDWGIDVHHPQGFWVRGNDCVHVYCNERISIPYRSLYSKNIDNLFMAGRCISVTHIALGGTRIMRTVCMTGQAAGTAAAIKNHIEQLQQLLLKDGCYLIGIPNNDPADLALTATATASSSAVGMTPENINNGWNRIVENKRNAWSPDPKEKLPQSIQLQLQKPSKINTIHLSFQKDNYRASEFTIEALLDETWKQISKVTNNHARRCVLNFNPVKTEKVRVTFKKAPASLALCEVRLYNEP
ncbi:MAG: FAD-dependent oxidoreductase, partial [Planctomycetota bacterium]